MLSIISIVSSLAAVAGVIFTLFQTHQSNKLTEKANEDQWKLIDDELDPRPRLKFTITAITSEIDDDSEVPKTVQKPTGYRLMVVNYGKAPAVLSMLPQGKYDWINSKYRPIGKAPLLTKSTKAHPQRVVVGSILPQFQNTVIIPANQLTEIFRANDLLAHEIHRHVGHPLVFLFYESIAATRIQLQLKFSDEEGVTVEEIAVETELINNDGSIANQQGLESAD